MVSAFPAFQVAGGELAQLNWLSFLGMWDGGRTGVGLKGFSGVLFFFSPFDTRMCAANEFRVSKAECPSSSMTTV